MSDYQCAMCGSRAGSVEAIVHGSECPSHRRNGGRVDPEIDAIERYLASCIRRRDWHGVSDAANDLRVLEAIEAAKATKR